MCGEQNIDLNNIDIEVLSARFIHKLIIHSHLKGYKYLILAITLGVKDVFSTGTNYIDYASILKRVSYHFDTNSKCVERSIRIAINNTYQKYPECYRDVFLCDSRPTSKNVIACAVDYIILYIKSEYNKQTLSNKENLVMKSRF